ncbi:MAG TPA: Gfo/Idh/MocA family oxidoreductase [Pirellulales bacterium]|jgi:predicted dehydrogenase|nr:Gfo/Idh/MocA family oxidoreductase [Pirellulales bacterium]
MASDLIRVGIIGLGGNARLRHVPGLRGCAGVEITAVCNRRRDSTAAAAAEFGIAKVYEHWQDLVADPQIDAIVIGTWPYLHCPITLAALAAGKHVLTEARMAMNAAEAHRMLAASRKCPDLICQIVPSPFGFRAHHVVLDLLRSGFIGELREVVVFATSDQLADAETPISWRQVRELSGLNMLTLGIVHETVMRWVPQPVRVLAQVRAFVGDRLDPATGLRRRVGTPDSVQVLATLYGGAHAVYHVSGVARFGMGTQIHLSGSEGALRYELAPEDRLFGARRGDSRLAEIEITPDKSMQWDVEAEFIGAIRRERRIEFSDFAAGVQYMEFTEAVARSAASGAAVKLPLDLKGD